MDGENEPCMADSSQYRVKKVSQNCKATKTYTRSVKRQSTTENIDAVLSSHQSHLSTDGVLQTEAKSSRIDKSRSVRGSVRNIQEPDLRKHANQVSKCLILLIKYYFTHCFFLAINNISNIEIKIKYF